MLILSKYSSENEGFRTEGRDLFINDITGDLQCMDYSSCRGRKIEIYDPLTNTAYYVMAQIETDQVVMMVDSGCTLSIMSKKVLKKIPPTSYTKPVKVVGSGILADGSRAPLSGSTLLSFDLAQRSFRHRFLIGDMANHTLLGLDFMEENQCTLDFNDGTLRFGDEVVSCCTVDGDPLKPNFYSDNDMTPDFIHHKASNPHRSSSRSEYSRPPTNPTRSKSQSKSHADDDSDEENEQDQELASDYKKGGYHPVNIGDSHNGYQIIRKIGWGYYSTVWLAYDKSLRRHVALKIVKSDKKCTEVAIEEIKMMKEAAEKLKSVRGRSHVVKMLDNFTISGPNGSHVCIVFELMGTNLLSLIVRSKFQGIPIENVKSIIKQTLLGLIHIHRDCNMIHTDIKPENVLLDTNEGAAHQTAKEMKRLWTSGKALPAAAVCNLPETGRDRGRKKKSRRDHRKRRGDKKSSSRKSKHGGKSRRDPRKVKFADKQAVKKKARMRRQERREHARHPTEIKEEGRYRREHSRSIDSDSSEGAYEDRRKSRGRSDEVKRDRKNRSSSRKPNADDYEDYQDYNYAMPSQDHHPNARNGNVDRWIEKTGETPTKKTQDSDEEDYEYSIKMRSSNDRQSRDANRKEREYAAANKRHELDAEGRKPHSIIEPLETDDEYSTRPKDILKGKNGRKTESQSSLIEKASRDEKPRESAEDSDEEDYEYGRERGSRKSRDANRKQRGNAESKRNHESDAVSRKPPPISEPLSTDDEYSTRPNDRLKGKKGRKTKSQSSLIEKASKGEKPRESAEDSYEEDYEYGRKRGSSKSRDASRKERENAEVNKSHESDAKGRKPPAIKENLSSDDEYSSRPKDVSKSKKRQKTGSQSSLIEKASKGEKPRIHAKDSDEEDYEYGRKRGSSKSRDANRKERENAELNKRHESNDKGRRPPSIGEPLSSDDEYSSRPKDVSKSKKRQKTGSQSSLIEKASKGEKPRIHAKDSDEEDYEYGRKRGSSKSRDASRKERENAEANKSHESDAKGRRPPAISENLSSDDEYSSKPKDVSKSKKRQKTGSQSSLIEKASKGEKPRIHAQDSDEEDYEYGRKRGSSKSRDANRKQRENAELNKRHESNDKGRKPPPIGEPLFSDDEYSTRPKDILKDKKRRTRSQSSLSSDESHQKLKSSKSKSNSRKAKEEEKRSDSSMSSEGRKKKIEMPKQRDKSRSREMEKPKQSKVSSADKPDRKSRELASNSSSTSRHSLTDSVNKNRSTPKDYKSNSEVKKRKKNHSHAPSDNDSQVSSDPETRKQNITKEQSDAAGSSVDVDRSKSSRKSKAKQKQKSRAREITSSESEEERSMSKRIKSADDEQNSKKSKKLKNAKNEEREPSVSSNSSFERRKNEKHEKQESSKGDRRQDAVDKKSKNQNHKVSEDRTQKEKLAKVVTELTKRPEKIDQISNDSDEDGSYMDRRSRLASESVNSIPNGHKDNPKHTSKVVPSEPSKSLIVTESAKRPEKLDQISHHNAGDGSDLNRRSILAKQSVDSMPKGQRDKPKRTSKVAPLELSKSLIEITALSDRIKDQGDRSKHRDSTRSADKDKTDNQVRREPDGQSAPDEDQIIQINPQEDPPVLRKGLDWTGYSLVTKHAEEAEVDDEDTAQAVVEGDIEVLRGRPNIDLSHRRTTEAQLIRSVFIPRDGEAEGPAMKSRKNSKGSLGNLINSCCGLKKNSLTGLCCGKKTEDVTPDDKPF